MGLYLSHPMWYTYSMTIKEDMKNKENILKVTIDQSGKDIRTEFVKAMSFAHARRITWNSLLTKDERVAGTTIKVERA